MANPTMPLAEWAEEGAGPNVLRAMVQFMAQRLMELGVHGVCWVGLNQAETWASRQPEWLARTSHARAASS